MAKSEECQELCLPALLFSRSLHFYSATFSAYVLCKALNGVCTARCGKKIRLKSSQDMQFVCSKVAYHKSPSLAGKLQAVTPTRVYDNEGKAIFEMNLRFFFFVSALSC